MAEKVKLRDYQKSILDKLDVIKSGDAATSSNYLGVEIGGRNVLVNLQDITETLVVTDIQPVPLVKPWFLGVSNVRGILYAVNDLNQLIDGLATEISSDSRMLLISDDITTNTGFLVDKLIGLRNPDTFKQQESVEAGSLCFKDDCYEDDGKNIWHILDCERLVGSSEFEVPYAV